MRWALVVLVLLAAAFAATPASAATRFRACPEKDAPRCTTVKVPLDRSGALGGTIGLHVERWNALRERRQGALFALAGGPGQSATAAFGEDGFSTLAAGLRDRDLIVFDQRGTGRSGALDCPGVEKALREYDLERESAAAEACARRLGARRPLFTTRESVADIEAVRRALGLERISIYGVSYGTKVALAYAKRYPNRIERLVLDSVQSLEGPNTLYLDTFAAMRRVFPALCRDGACPFTLDPVADLSALVARLGEQRLAGFVVDARGRPRRRSMGRFELFTLALSGDFSPPLRAAMPAAVRSALDGDAAPLLRLVRDATGGAALPPFAATPGVERLSNGLFVATTCEESVFPWGRTSSPAERSAQAQATAEGLPESAFTPFDRPAALDNELLRLCLRWPTGPVAPDLMGGALPDVPALLLSGEDDLRTPVEEAERVAAELPGATLVRVPATGHGLLSQGARCVEVALKRFFTGRRVDPRCRQERVDPPAPYLPDSLAEVAPTPGVAGDIGRTLAAVGLTLRDVEEQSEAYERGGGLRGGRFLNRPLAGGVELRKVVVVPGVEVSGPLDFTDDFQLEGSFEVTGSGVTGTVRLGPDGLLSGRLGGRRVKSPPGTGPAVEP